jgi:hypothetical protein
MRLSRNCFEFLRMVSDFKLTLEVIGHVRGSTHGGYGGNGRCS